MLSIVLALLFAAHPLPGAARSAPFAHQSFSSDSTRADSIVHGTVRTDSLYASALGAEKHYLVYLPPSYGTDTTRRYPVAYYLHGLYGAETDWVEHGHLDAAMDSLVARGMPEMIVVMPDGDDGWYTTWNTIGDYSGCVADTTRKEPASSYCVRWLHYDDYIAHDLIQHVDSIYRTIGNRAHRGIAGLSMGGYGAIALALQYPTKWSAAASHSGVLSPMYAGPHPFKGAPVYATSFEQIEAQWAGNPGGARWSSRRLAFGKDLPAWRWRDPAHRVRALLDQPSSAGTRLPALYMDVGSDDHLADDTRVFHAELKLLGVPHEFAEYPGIHDWDYWSAHVGQSLAWLAEHIARPDSVTAAR
ncbi:MAG TPA: alpha/beta hydrolase-fold protein [Gemmatimonadaceae bacterium]|nr:alpha/beta hydrolase-fold protein [Gemmatimonadaceae bacterium]